MIKFVHNASCCNTSAIARYSYSPRDCYEKDYRNEMGLKIKIKKHQANITLLLTMFVLCR